MRSAESPDNDIISLLLSIGLSEREARVYHALLINGEKQAKEIAKITGIPQPHVYSILKTLQSREIVETYHGEKKKYRAIPLNHTIDRLISEKEQALKMLRTRSHEIAQKIQADERRVIAGELKLVIGKDSLEKKAMEMIMSAKKEVLSITPAARLFHHSEYLPFSKNLKSRGVKLRIIAYLDGEIVKDVTSFIEASADIKFIKHKISKKLIVDDAALLNVEVNEDLFAMDFGIWTNHGEVVTRTKEQFEKRWKSA